MEKTPGQLAYERDLAKVPLYPADCGVGFMGTPRPTWDQLPKIARWSWERNPTDRPWVRASGVAGSGVVESATPPTETRTEGG